MTVAGVNLLAEVVLKVPIGGGGALEVGLGGSYFPGDYDTQSTSGSASTTRVGLGLGYGVFF